MYTLSIADRVWNRACEGGGPNPRAGDQALAALLRAHGMLMNGGVFHVFDTLDGDELAAAYAGYRFFGLHEAVSLLERARVMSDEFRDESEMPLGAEYGRLAGDPLLGDVFKSHFAAHPDEYSPLDV